MCKNREEALLEDIVEITMIFDILSHNEEIKPLHIIGDSRAVKDKIINIAQEFENKYPFESTWIDSDLIYEEEIFKFAKEKFLEEYKI